MCISYFIQLLSSILSGQKEDTVEKFELQYQPGKKKKKKQVGQKLDFKKWGGMRLQLEYKLHLA